MGWSTTTSRGAVADRALVQCREDEKVRCGKVFLSRGGARAPGVMGPWEEKERKC